MNAVVESIFVEDDFFAPSTFDMVDGLVASYNHSKASIETLHTIVQGTDTIDAMHYFLTGNNDDGRYHAPSIERLFALDGALAALNSAFWSKAMLATDLMTHMPQKRRDEWNELIRTKKCPEFEESTVRATLQDLTSKRHQFLAERVDGIFRGLSGDHVTNSPAGFGKRMIISRVIEGDWNWINNSRSGLINDLRAVIAKFMGRDEPYYTATDAVIEHLKHNWGDWVQVDGGSLKIRLYKKGTAHLEVHPDMAWRLNGILAHLYPAAIPPEFRSKPKRKTAEINLIQRPLPFAVLSSLQGLKQGYKLIKTDNFRDPYEKKFIPNSIDYVPNQPGTDKHARIEAENVLISIGGVLVDGLYVFDYDPLPVIGEIVASGVIPDDKSHQFYPTPEKVAKYAAELLDPREDDVVLEPSAGIGSLADAVSPAVVQCVEVSALRCEILKAKGYTVDCSDFIAWSDKQRHEQFSKIIMNPPFDRGQWKAHVEHALPLLKKGGRLVAILPEGANGKFYPDGLNCTYPQTFKNEFASTSVSVCILVADKARS